MTFATADKNKSAFKLRNFGPIYYLNLDDQPERREYMEDQFKYWEIDNYERISAYDGRDDDLGHIIKGTYPDMMTSGEIGCTTSHLKALKHWLETSDSPYAIIMEDDCSLKQLSAGTLYGTTLLHMLHMTMMSFNLQSFALVIFMLKFTSGL